jgi:hypothetical protein
VTASGLDLSLPGGPSLRLPAGALPSGTVVTIHPAGTAAPAGALTPLFQFGPSGPLAVPGTVTFDMAGATPNAVVRWTQSGSSTAYQDLVTSVSGTKVSAPVEHFSLAYVVDPGYLGGRAYNQWYICNYATGEVPTCSDNAQEPLIFTRVGATSVYQGRSSPETSFVYSGTLDPASRTYAWTATSPGQYTEAGTWTFSADWQTFAGDSNYSSVAGVSPAYHGYCAETGAAGGAVPAHPGPVPACSVE